MLAPPDFHTIFNFIKFKMNKSQLFCICASNFSNLFSHFPNSLMCILWEKVFLHASQETHPIPCGKPFPKNTPELDEGKSKPSGAL